MLQVIEYFDLIKVRKLSRFQKRKKEKLMVESFCKILYFLKISYDSMNVVIC